MKKYIVRTIILAACFILAMAFSGCNRYFTPDQAIEYGLIDKVISPADDVAIERRDYEGMLRASQAQNRSARPTPSGGGGAAADA